MTANIQTIFFDVGNTLRIVLPTRSLLTGRKPVSWN